MTDGVDPDAHPDAMWRPDYVPASEPPGRRPAEVAGGAQSGDEADAAVDADAGSRQLGLVGSPDDPFSANYRAIGRGAPVTGEQHAPAPPENPVGPDPWADGDPGLAWDTAPAVETSDGGVSWLPGPADDASDAPSTRPVASVATRPRSRPAFAALASIVAVVLLAGLIVGLAGVIEPDASDAAVERARLPGSLDELWSVPYEGFVRSSNVRARDDVVAFVLDESAASDRTLIVLDADTGVERWRQRVAVTGVPDLLTISSTTAVVTTFSEVGSVVTGYDLETGEQAWESEQSGRTQIVDLRGFGALVAFDFARPSRVEVIDAETGESLGRLDGEPINLDLAGRLHVVEDGGSVSELRVLREGDDLVLSSEPIAVTETATELLAAYAENYVAVELSVGLGPEITPSGDRPVEIVDRRPEDDIERDGPLPDLTTGGRVRPLADGSGLVVLVVDRREPLLLGSEHRNGAIEITWSAPGFPLGGFISERGPIVIASAPSVVRDEDASTSDLVTATDTQLLDMRTGDPIATFVNASIQADPGVAANGAIVAVRDVDDAEQRFQAVDLDGQILWSLDEDAEPIAVGDGLVVVLDVGPGESVLRGYGDR